jgi:hypothetical protein
VCRGGNARPGCRGDAVRRTTCMLLSVWSSHSRPAALCSCCQGAELGDRVAVHICPPNPTHTHHSHDCHAPNKTFCDMHKAAPYPITALKVPRTARVNQSPLALYPFPMHSPHTHPHASCDVCPPQQPQEYSKCMPSRAHSSTPCFALSSSQGLVMMMILHDTCSLRACTHTHNTPSAPCTQIHIPSTPTPTHPFQPHPHTRTHTPVPPPNPSRAAAAAAKFKAAMERADSVRISAFSLSRSRISASACDRSARICATHTHTHTHTCE